MPPQTPRRMVRRGVNSCRCRTFSFRAAPLPYLRRVAQLQPSVVAAARCIAVAAVAAIGFVFRDAIFGDARRRCATSCAATSSRPSWRADASSRRSGSRSARSSPNASRGSRSRKDRAVRRGDMLIAARRSRRARGACAGRGRGRAGRREASASCAKRRCRRPSRRCGRPKRICCSRVTARAQRRPQGEGLRQRLGARGREAQPRRRREPAQAARLQVRGEQARRQRLPDGGDGARAGAR